MPQGECLTRWFRCPEELVAIVALADHFHTGVLTRTLCLEIAHRLRPTRKEGLMRPKGRAAELERRRIRAVELVEQGESLNVVARILGVQAGSIYRWRRLARQEGGLAARPIP